MTNVPENETISNEKKHTPYNSFSDTVNANAKKLKSNLIHKLVPSRRKYEKKYFFFNYF